MSGELQLETDESGATADALLDLLSEDREAMVHLTHASKFIVLPTKIVTILRTALVRRGQHYPYDEVEAAIYEVALDLFPASWAAAKERLNLYVLARREQPVEQMPEDAIKVLAHASRTHLMELASLSLGVLEGDELLRVTRVLWSTLSEVGKRFEPEHFSDHVYAVVRDLFPHAQGARWSSRWAEEILSRDIQYVAERYIEGADLSATEDTVDEITTAGLAEDRRRYRRAVRAWVVAHLQAFDAFDVSNLSLTD